MANQLAFSSYVQGTSHAAKGQPCEDYALAEVIDAARGVGIAIDSDGHGEERAFRSADGARFACEETMTILSTFAGEAQEAEIHHRIVRDERDFFTKLEGQILRAWLNRIEKDLIERPFTPEELTALEEKNREYFADRVHNVKAYGCTLAAAFVTPTYWFCVTMGDSVCYEVATSGTYLNPVPAVEGNVANVVHSLCESDAMRWFAHCYSETVPEAVFVMSDGVEESFPRSSLKLAGFLRSVSQPFQKGDKGADSQLRTSLQNLTQSGSADDVSVAAIVPATRPLPEPKYSGAQVKQVYEATLLQIDGMKASVENNSVALRQAREELDTRRMRYARYQDEITAAEREVTRIEAIKAENESALRELEKRRDQIRASVEQKVQTVSPTPAPTSSASLSDEIVLPGAPAELSATSSDETDEVAVGSALDADPNMVDLDNSRDSDSDGGGECPLESEATSQRREMVVSSSEDDDTPDADAAAPFPTPTPEQQRAWRRDGRCQYCGSKTNLFKRVCKNCEREQKN